jgi:ATP-dependent DNA helicase RecG
MPTLDWLNRQAAFTTAARVPYRLLEPVSSHGDAASGNLLIQGDNLKALKALLPLYRGQVKCIFIDPPYNTKSAFEHYDDNLEHAQWLSMMLPRLQLLRELLREDGSIWVTIDDNEGHYLKVLMDEVFGRGNFVANALIGIRDFADYTPENVIHRVLGKTPNLPSLDFRVEERRASDTGAVVWLVHVPRHAPRQPVYAHDKAWQRDGDALTELRADRLRAILAEPLSGHDWSAGLLPGATVTDLDASALVLARKQFAAKNSQERWSAEIGQWSDAEFLDRARLNAGGVLTRTTLLLLGKPESTHRLEHPAEMVWRLLEERAAWAFHPPFLLTSSELLRQVRNPNIKLSPATSLLAVELPKYETRVVLEALHNCIAHQDYERGERIVVDESVSRLTFQSAGSFVDGEANDYAVAGRVPSRYRNPWLANAMRSIGMIDSAGFGIREMFQEQRK